MIRVNKIKEPDYLLSDEVDLVVEKLENFYASKNRSQRRFNFARHLNIDKRIKEYLHAAFNGKCGYCEIGIDSPNAGTIDRYRPHNGVRDNDEYYNDLYWWLAFEWENLIYCCRECNQYKANYFPISGKRANSKSDDLSAEKRLILNPYTDDPSQHFGYNDDGSMYGLSQEGEQTVELLRLNRQNLVDGRINARKNIVELCESIIRSGSADKQSISILQGIYEENSDIPFVGFSKWMLISEMESDPFLGSLLSIEDYQNPDIEEIKQKRTNKSFFTYSEKKKNQIVKNDYFPIEYIHIRNFKSIDDLRIDFKEDELNNKSWLFLLGENGVGKSSILQAIAIGLKQDSNIDNSIISRLVKKGKQRAIIEIKERNSDNMIRTTLIKKDGSIHNEGRFDSFLIGYGSLRLSADEVNNNQKKDTEKISYENLFKPTKPLNDITKWLKSIYNNKRGYFDSIAFSIKQLLPDDSINKELIIKNGEITFKDSEVLFPELSDGFKSTITLAVDIMMKLSAAQADIDKMSGIVLIDELGNQLHPRWQMRVVSQLRTVFPNINFIISTHHPLCLRGAKSDEILLLKNIENEVVPIVDLPDPSSLRVDQILSSEFFGLSSLVDPEIEATFNRYYFLLSNSNEEGNNDQEIAQLRDFLRDKQQLGASLREELMYSTIDNLLAKQVIYNKNSIDRNSLKTETISRVKEIWRKLNFDNYDKGQ